MASAAAKEVTVAVVAYLAVEVAAVGAVVEAVEMASGAAMMAAWVGGLHGQCAYGSCPHDHTLPIPPSPYAASM